MSNYNAGRALLATLISALICVNCNPGSTDSTNIATPGIYAGMEIESSVSGNSSINVELNVGGRNGTNIDLSDGERLEVSVGGETIMLNRDTDFGDIDYEGTVNTSSSADPFRISLFRADGSVINNSIVSLPDEFIITSPNSGQTFSVNETLPIRWTPARSG